ncbi:MAG: ExbD/TolR family protein [Candidatus Krumholzibacteria bacterium]|jgi:biopolymer transport protein TolR|nr:ExbD/TolR family protein [Candidatus Krumholzibacteria bacterium]
MRKSKYSTVSDINVTSLVDVTMVLLIIFMLTAPFIQAGIKVKLPKAKSTVIKETEAVVISVNKEGEIFINNEKVEAEQLGDALLTLKVAGEERVFIRADKDVPYGAVMNVIGEVKSAGINDVGMITEMKDGRKRR